MQLVSKSYVRNVSIFSFNMGLNICGVWTSGGDDSLAINVFGGIYRCIGRRYELRVYEEPSIRLFCIWLCPHCHENECWQ